MKKKAVSHSKNEGISNSNRERSAKDGEFFFSNWLRNRNTIEFLGIWERLMNPNFNCAEFDIIKSQAGLNRFRLSAKEWTEKTNAIGLSRRQGVKITGLVLVIILQGNIFVELRTNLYLCRRRLISWGEYGTTVKEEKRNGNLPCDGQRHQPSGLFITVSPYHRNI